LRLFSTLPCLPIGKAHCESQLSVTTHSHTAIRTKTGTKQQTFALKSLLPDLLIIPRRDRARDQRSQLLLIDSPLVAFEDVVVESEFVAPGAVPGGCVADVAGGVGRDFAGGGDGDGGGGGW